MTPVREPKKEITDTSFLRWAPPAAALFGVFAFWTGMVMAARRYPSEYDWRYMPVTRLLSPEHDPAGYLWAWTGIVLYSLGGFCWATFLARRGNHEGAEDRPKGIRALQFGYIFAICAAVLPQWLLRLERGHEFLTLLAFAGLCVGMIRLMFQTMERTLRKRMRRFTGHARWLASFLAGSAAFPILLAALAQLYVFYAHPELRWVSLSWRDRGVPVYLSFDFWEWVTCFALSAYTVILSLAFSAVHPLRKAGERR